MGIHRLLEGIPRLRNLRSLELNLPLHQNIVVHALRGMTFPTQLERFVTNQHSTDIRSFDELFSIMRSIKSIQWMYNGLTNEPERPIAPLKDPLPNLTELIVCLWPFTALMCGSPVTHLTIQHSVPGDPQEILRHVRRSTRDLTHLEVGFHPGSIPSPTVLLCSNLVQHIPSLRYLKISIRSPTIYNYRKEGFKSLRILAQ